MVKHTVFLDISHSPIKSAIKTIQFTVTHAYEKIGPGKEVRYCVTAESLLCWLDTFNYTVRNHRESTDLHTKSMAHERRGRLRMGGQFVSATWLSWSSNNTMAMSTLALAEKQQSETQTQWCSVLTAHPQWMEALSGIWSITTTFVNSRASVHFKKVIL